MACRRYPSTGAREYVTKEITWKHPAQGTPTPKSDLLMVVCRLEPAAFKTVAQLASHEQISTAAALRRIVDEWIEQQK